MSRKERTPARTRRVAFWISLSLAFLACGRGGQDSVSGLSEDMNPHAPGASLPPRPPGEIRKPSYRPRGLSTKVFKTAAGDTYAPMDFINEDVTLKFDLKSRAITGTARIDFQIHESGHPYFLFEGQLSKVAIEGSSTTFQTVSTPDGAMAVRAFGPALAPERYYQALIQFSLASERATFANGGVSFLNGMADLLGRFSQRYWPSGFEDDDFALTLTLQAPGAIGMHKVYTNGEVTARTSSEWRVRFPSYFSTSSCFVHLTNRNFPEAKLTIQGEERQIPVTVYGDVASEVVTAKVQLPALFKELERDYGPYVHPSFVAFVTSFNGGMEYSGATITSARSLSHELFHSWFARGVYPAEGRSGWIDEALASWRDNGYQRASTLLSRAPTTMGDESPYLLQTARNSYADGRALMAEFDLLFAKAGGLKPLLRDFMDHYRFARYTSEEFRWFLESETGVNLGAYFKRYVDARETDSSTERIR